MTSPAAPAKITTTMKHFNKCAAACKAEAAAKAKKAVWKRSEPIPAHPTNEAGCSTSHSRKRKKDSSDEETDCSEDERVTAAREEHVDEDSGGPSDDSDDPSDAESSSSGTDPSEDDVPLDSRLWLDRRLGTNQDPFFGDDDPTCMYYNLKTGEKTK